MSPPGGPSPPSPSSTSVAVTILNIVAPVDVRGCVGAAAVLDITTVADVVTVGGGVAIVVVAVDVVCR
jgi:hypothetical protein